MSGEYENSESFSERPGGVVVNVIRLIKTGYKPPLSIADGQSSQPAEKSDLVFQVQTMAESVQKSLADEQESPPPIQIALKIEKKSADKSIAEIGSSVLSQEDKQDGESFPRAKKGLVVLLASAVTLSVAGAGAWLLLQENMRKADHREPAAVQLPLLEGREEVPEPVNPSAKDPTRSVEEASTANQVGLEKPTPPKVKETQPKITPAELSQPKVEAGKLREEKESSKAGVKAAEKKTDTAAETPVTAKPQKIFDYSLAPEHGTAEDRRRAEEQLEIIRSLRNQQNQ